jgi:hypothetical protein
MSFPDYVVKPAPGMVVKKNNGVRRILAVDGNKVLFQTLSTGGERLTTYNQWVQWAFNGVLLSEMEVEVWEHERHERAEFLRELRTFAL